jgi:TonB family protein
MPLRTFWWWVVLAAAAPLVCLASDGNGLRVMGGKVALRTREHQVWGFPMRDSRFADVPHSTARASCEATKPPEALATPSPLLDPPHSTVKVTVSFIIGTDGRVHSPFILESAGPSEDRTVLSVVRSWRYRPAMCNGVPTEAEGKIEFSSR